MQDLRVAFAVFQEPFGLVATVTRPAPDDTPITTSVLWLTPSTDDAPGGVDFHRREPIRVLGISRVDVPTLPRGTRIVVPPQGGAAAQTWQTERIVVEDVDAWRVLVVEA